MKSESLKAERENLELKVWGKMESILLKEEGKNSDKKNGL